MEHLATHDPSLGNRLRVKAELGGEVWALGLEVVWFAGPRTAQRSFQGVNHGVVTSNEDSALQYKCS